MAERKTFRLEVISPERIFYTGDGGTYDDGR